MAKFCCICNKPLQGKARKYCAECKRKEHQQQMHQYYVDNTKNWQYGGKYWNNQSFGKCGTGSLGEKSTLDWDKEMKKIKREMLNLGLEKPIE